MKKGELLFEIDERPYAYALERAISDQAALEGQISDEGRRIAALVSAVSAAQANIRSSEADVTRLAAAIDQARADLASAEQGVQRARAEWAYAKNNLNRIEPLLAKQFVTIDQVDRAQSSETVLAEALKQAESRSTAFAGRIAIGFGAIRTRESCRGTEHGATRTIRTCRHDTRTTDQPAWRKRSGSERRPLQSRELPGLCAIRCSRYKSHDLHTAPTPTLDSKCLHSSTPRPGRL